MACSRWWTLRLSSVFFVTVHKNYRRRLILFCFPGSSYTPEERLLVSLGLNARHPDVLLVTIKTYIWQSKQNSVYYDLLPQGRGYRYHLPYLYCLLGLFASPLVRTYQFGSHWKNFRRSLHWRLQLKSIEKIQIRLKFGHNSGHVTWRPKQFSSVDSSKKM